jgi:hypothetical protein
MAANFKILSDGKVYRKMKKIYANRDVYDGEFVDGLREGKGIIQCRYSEFTSTSSEGAEKV